MWWFSVDRVFKIQHYIGILFTLGTFYTLFNNKNIFTLALGLTLAIGNFGGLSPLIDIWTWYSTFNIGSLHIPVYYGQPVYSVMFFVYLVFNKEFYIGVVTKEYWQGFLTRKKDLELVFTTITVDTQKIENIENDAE
jgi:hypothetical protein